MKKLILFLAAVSVWVFLAAVLGGIFMSENETKKLLSALFVPQGGYVQWRFMPTEPSLVSLVKLLFDTPEFYVMFWNSTIMVLLELAGQLLFGAPAAWALSRLRFRARRFLTGIYIILMLLPFSVTMVPSYMVLNSLSLLDTVWSVVLPSAFSCFAVFIMLRGFDAVPHALLEAAALDGAGHFARFIRIGVPLGMPGIASALVLSFLEGWSMIEQPLTFLKTKSMWPLSLYLPQIGYDEIGIAMVASAFTLAPALLVFLFGQKYLELGIQAAGIKE